jgi:Ca2+-binding RTX toxin-like protein
MSLPFYGGQIDTVTMDAGTTQEYSVNLVANETYYLQILNINMTDADDPSPVSSIFTVLGGPLLGIPWSVINNEELSARQVISYTPQVSGTFDLEFESTTSQGSFSFTGGEAWANLTDTTTGVTSTPFITPYSGPVAGLTGQFIDLSPDNLNITATTPSVFLHSGAGEDALQVTSGNNVLDGSTGSNFLVGGTGADTFFVDDRHATADIWSTVVGFHSGDNATVWGITKGAFDLSWINGQGASGYSGLTMHAAASGEPTASLTVSGFSSADLTNGRLTVSYGTTPNLPNLPGGNYMLIHCN